MTDQKYITSELAMRMCKDSYYTGMKHMAEVIKSTMEQTIKLVEDNLPEMGIKHD